MESPIKISGAFGVRNDKYRGLLVETLETSNGNQYFFKFHHQLLSQHCDQFQVIVKAANVQTAKKLTVDMTPFVHEYVRLEDSTIMFKGTKLTSVVTQIEKAYTMRINKEMGIAKRQQTMAANKQAKTVAKNQKMRKLYASAEAEFQAERARRIDRLFGGQSGQPVSSQAASTAGPSGQQANVNNQAASTSDSDMV